MEQVPPWHKLRRGALLILIFDPPVDLVVFVLTCSMKTGEQWAVSYIPWLRELWVLPVACLSVCMAMACMRVIWTHVHMCIIVAAPLIFPPMPRWPQPELTESLSLPETILQHMRSLVNTQPDDHIHWPLTVFNKVTLGTQQTISVRRINYQHVVDRRGPD